MAPIANPLALDPLEIASGLPLGHQRGTEELPALNPRISPREALAEAIAPALECDPCLITFSGGRDSSAILAVALDTARRRGMSEPTAVTMRFPGEPETDEAKWQQLVADHLGLSRWEVIEPEGLGAVGPVARALLRRHGLLYPSNTHFLTPLLERARGGALLTGIDGDGLFGQWRSAPLVAALGGRVRPQLAHLRRLTTALAPRRARAAWTRRRFEPPQSWLTDTGRERLRDRYARQHASEPLSWRARTGWYASGRRIRLLERSYELVGRDIGARPFHPLLDRRFLAALARDGSFGSYAGRERAMRRLFADLLPEELITRPTKAVFSGAAWGEEVEDFARAWSGEGLASELVDRAALREAWRRGRDFRAVLALQAAWLATSTSVRASA